MFFNHEKLFQLVLNLEEPWFVKHIEFNKDAGELHIYIDFRRGASFPCPVCGEPAKAHDTEEQTWRHLNFFQYKAFLHSRTPRNKCSVHGVRLVKVPWSRPGSDFTLLFEAMVLAMAAQMPVVAIARLVDEHDTRLWRIIKHYVQLFEDLSRWNFKTAQAYRMKLALQEVYQSPDRVTAEEGLRRLYWWLVHSRLDPMKELGRTIKAHWEEILNYFDHRRTNWVLEAVNGLVQVARSKACGYRNIDNFITMVYLIAGKLHFDTCMG